MIAIRDRVNAGGFVRIRRQLDASFIAAVRRSGHSVSSLAACAGWASYSQLSEILSSGEIRPTKLQLERLSKLAVLVGFEGDPLLGVGHE